MNGKMTNNKENLKREEQSLCVPFGQNQFTGFECLPNVSAKEQKQEEE